MKMKYGGPDNGRPTMQRGKISKSRKAKMAMTPNSEGRHYLVGARGHVANQNRKMGSMTISKKVKRQLSR